MWKDFSKSIKGVPSDFLNSAMIQAPNRVTPIRPNFSKKCLIGAGAKDIASMIMMKITNTTRPIFCSRVAFGAPPSVLNSAILETLMRNTNFISAM